MMEGMALQRFGGHAHQAHEAAAAAGVLHQIDSRTNAHGTAIAKASSAMMTVEASAGRSDTFSEVYSHWNRSGVSAGTPRTRM